MAGGEIDGSLQDRNGRNLISLRHWVKVLLGRVDRRFTKHHSFLFVLYNIILRREILVARTYMVNEVDCNVFKELNEEQKKTLGEVLSGEKKAFNVKDSKVRRANNLVRKLGRHVPKNAHMMAARRRGISNGKLVMFGAPNFFLTVNFDSEKHILFLAFAGAREWGSEELMAQFELPNWKIPVSGEKRTSFQHGTTLFERQIIGASDPVALAASFDHLVRGMILYLFQFELNAEKRAGFIGYEDAYPGIFGRVKYFDLQTELNFRRLLHSHTSMQLWEYNAEVIQAKLQDPEFKEQLVSYIDSISDARIVPGLDYNSFKGEGKAEARFDREENKRGRSENYHGKKRKWQKVRMLETLHEPLGMTIPPLLRVEETNEGCLPVDETEHEFDKQFLESIATLKREYQMHNCTFTCFKTLKARQDRKCRLRHDRLPVRSSTDIEVETGRVKLRRDVKRMVETNLSLLYCSSCNSKAEFLPAHKALAASCYVYKYTIKLNGNAPVDIAWLQNKIGRRLHDEEAGGKKIVGSLAMSVLGSLQFAGSEVAQALMEIPDYYSSHETASLDWFSIIKVLNQQCHLSIEEFGLQDHSLSLSYYVETNKGYATRLFSENYTYLEETKLSPYEIVMCYEKRCLSRTKNIKNMYKLKFNKRHMDHKTHCMVRRKGIAVPVLQAPFGMPREADHMFKLFIVVVFSNFGITMLKLGKSGGNIDYAMVDDLYNNLVNEKEWIRCAVENILDSERANDAAADERRKKIEERTMGNMTQRNLSLRTMTMRMRI